MAGIFKAYDIRGKVDELSPELAYRIGKAFVAAMNAQGKRLACGHDMRPTSRPFSEEVIRGMRDAGALVVDCGLVSTPLFYFAASKLDGGCMVTASHDPPDYNGFKFVSRNLPVSHNSGLDEIERLVQEGLPEVDAGTIEQYDFLPEFLDFAFSRLTIQKPVRIVVDAGNGMGGYTYGAALERFKDRGIDVEQLSFELDGTFPSRDPNPVKVEALRALMEVVVEKGATLGVALDGDGDRCVFVDEKGQHIPSDLLLALLARHRLRKRKGSIVLDLRCSRTVFEEIAEQGGTAVPSPVGYANIKPRCHERKAVFAGEISGHFFPEETGYNENTLLVLFEVLSILEETGKTLSGLIDPLRRYEDSGEVNAEVEDPDAVIAAVKARYAREAQSVSEIDGVKIDFPSWWCCVRKSNTEPLVRLVCEARTREEMEQRRDEILGIIRGS